MEHGHRRYYVAPATGVVAPVSEIGVRSRRFADPDVEALCLADGPPLDDAAELPRLVRPQSGGREIPEGAWDFVSEYRRIFVSMVAKHPTLAWAVEHKIGLAVAAIIWLLPIWLLG